MILMDNASYRYEAVRAIVDMLTMCGIGIKNHRELNTKHRIRRSKKSIRWSSRDARIFLMCVAFGGHVLGWLMVTCHVHIHVDPELAGRSVT